MNKKRSIKYVFDLQDTSTMNIFELLPEAFELAVSPSCSSTSSKFHLRLPLQLLKTISA
jgi:hypothetical protein